MGHPKGITFYRFFSIEVNYPNPANQRKRLPSILSPTPGTNRTIRTTVTNTAPAIQYDDFTLSLRTCLYWVAPSRKATIPLPRLRQVSFRLHIFG